MDNALTVLSRYLRELLAVLYPSTCIACESFIADAAIVCAACTTVLRPAASFVMPVTAVRSLSVIPACLYEGPVVGLVLAKQWRNLGAARALGLLVAAHLARLESRYDCVMAVPLHWTRYARRGYNQSYEMARVVAAKCTLPLYVPFYRRRATASQTAVNGAERRANVAGAFAPLFSLSYARTRIAGKHVLIIDDVFTTGATVQALAQQVFAAGAATVTVAVACRAV